MDNLMELRLAEYDDIIDDYKQLSDIAVGLLEKSLEEAGQKPMQISHRIKTKESVAGKMERKSDKYPSVHNMRDLLGIRIICYFGYQVDEAAALIQNILVIDPEHSVDKRKSLDPTAFGYLSLHFICSLPKDHGYPERLCNLQFEIQIRTILQHTWAEIEHDLGYKTEFSIPRHVRREFSRVAGLLEIADDAFLRIRNTINDYEQEVRTRIANDTANQMQLDLVTLRAYLELSGNMRNLLTDIAAITHSRIVETNPESHLQNLAFFKIQTLGDLNAFVLKWYGRAVEFAKRTLRSIELDEISSVAGIYYLCRACLVHGNYDEGQLMEFFRLNESSEKRAKQQTGHILRMRTAL